MAVDVEHGDGIATVRLNRPQVLNAFDTAQLRRLLDAFRALREERTVRCVILTGAGDKAFAAGADIKEMVEKSEAQALEFGRLGHAVTAAVEGLPQPTIAAVNGYAFGGGCELVLACDIRLASDRAQFSQPEVGLGIPPGWGGTQRLPRLIGPGRAAELIFTGRRVAAEEALRIGLVNAVYPTDRLLPEAETLARTIAANSPRAIRAAKQAMAVAFTGPAASGLESELALFGASFGTADRREGMQAFIEKRAARFTAA